MAIGTDEEILKEFNQILKDSSATGWDIWRRYEVKDGYRFFFGLDQWDEITKAKLHNQGLKEITMNRIPPFINSVQAEQGRQNPQINSIVYG